MAITLKILKAEYEKIIAHAKEVYPHECCGVIAGKGSGETREVIRAFRAVNFNEDRAHDRYDMDPKDQLRIEKEARGEGLDVIGIYHSHPDHPDEPSQFDRDRGWPDYSYIIVAVQGGTETTLRSWSYSEDDAPFTEETVEIS